MMCCLLDRKSHRYSDVKEVAEDLVKQTSSNAQILATKVTDCQMVLKNVDQNWSIFCDETAKTEEFICDRAEEMKQSIEAHKQSLLEQLSVWKDEQLKQTMSVHEKVERHQVVLENFIRYSNELKEKGTACDIAKLAGKLNERAAELEKLNVDTDLTNDYNVTEVNFISSGQMGGIQNMFGSLARYVSGMCDYSTILIKLNPFVC